MTNKRAKNQNNKKITRTILIAILIIIAIVYFSNNAKEKTTNEEISTPNNIVTTTLELTKDGVTKTVKHRTNFIFSQEPLLLVQLNGMNAEKTTAIFVVRSGEGKKVNGEWIWPDTEQFPISIGESYYYKPEDLNIKLISISEN